MKFDWINYLELAEDLLYNSDPNTPDVELSTLSQAELRSSISRSYYAAFHVAKRYLYKVRRCTIPKQDTHKSLIKELQSTGDPDLIYIGNLLENLRNRRNEADYDDILLNLQQRAEEAVEISKLIIHKLMVLLGRVIS